MKPLLFAVTLFVSAALLFLVQPMVGRMLLPSLGGSPAVWNTCLVFFQTVLLFGYLYAHLATRWFGVPRQATFHLVLLAIPFFVLPIAVDSSRLPDSDAPAWWLLLTLTMVVGLPFFVVSTTGPLLQKWFAASGHRSAGDPYFLYAASNLGSLLALLAYPLVVEMWLPLSRQADLWRWVYLGYVGLCVLCGLTVLARTNAESSPTLVDQPVPLRTVLRWIGLAFVPSSLLMAVTTHLTTDIAPIPLLWVVPLGIYLLTFVVAFSKSIRLPLGWLGRLLAISVIASAMMLLLGATEPIVLIAAVHLLTLLFAGLLCHGTLSSERPGPTHLTAFYLWLSVGGVLGGAFNALAAPILFHKLGYVEYPLMLVVLSLLARKFDGRIRLLDLVGPLAVGVVVSVLVAQPEKAPALRGFFQSLATDTGFEFGMVRNAFLFGIPAILVYTFVDRPVRFALGLAALFFAGTLDNGPQGKTLWLERNYLGVIRVTADDDGKFHRMIHGNTIHGQQWIGTSPRYKASLLQTLAPTTPLQSVALQLIAEDIWSRPNEPLTYYHTSGPAGQVFRNLAGERSHVRRVGVVGLGIGSLAAYAKPNQDWVFFELDPAVIRLAQNEKYFTFLRDCGAKSLEVIPGDARLQLARLPDHHFDILVLDAFSSDAIPIHLMTAEAMALYQRKLAPGGVLLFHVSNRYLALPPILGRLAENAQPPLYYRVERDLGLSDKEKANGKEPSIWVLLAEKQEDFGILQKKWATEKLPANTPLWTDDRANVLGALQRGSED